MVNLVIVLQGALESAALTLFDYLSLHVLLCLIPAFFIAGAMARGPLLAYLLADPELSIQSILVTRKFLGDKKNTVFVGLVTMFSVIAGLIFGLLLGQG